MYLPNSDINQLQVNEISKKIKTQQIINIEHQQQASFISQWKNSLNNREENGNNNCKLRTYKLIKLDFKLEPYLEKLNNPELRSIICKFRLSDHKLEIEKGRHHKIPAKSRLCKICNSTLVEDEKHFILQCPLYNLLRHDLFSEAAKHINNYRNLTEEQQFKEIMSNKTLIIALGKYIKLSNIKREHHLQNTHNI